MSGNKSSNLTNESSFAYLGLGSNLCEPIFQLEKALLKLIQSENIHLISYSSIYQTPPFDFSNQPDYYNLAIKIKTDLQPPKLLEFLKSLEKKQGRKNAKKWGARIIDIDILLFNNSHYKDLNLIIPHQSLTERNFFLKPLLEVTPIDFEFEGLGKIKKHLEKINSPIKKVKSRKEIKLSLKRDFD